MKNLALLITFSFVFFSCQKDYYISNKEVPKWLKDNIEQQEQIIKDSPQLMNSWGAWLRFNWKNEYYFEYHNVLSSSLPRAISTNGDTLHFYATDANTEYFKEKCCKEYVWKAPKYDDLPGI
jgi:hypothetical protein